jgi:iron complex outermembrane receptor protein
MSPRTLRLRTVLALSASVSALAALASPAFAQQAAAGTTGAATVEELVITAEKREQSLQDVPVAVSAYTSTKRDVVGMTSIQDFVNFTPGMNYSGTDRLSLRGAGRNTYYIGNDPGVATYSDGFYSASSSELFKSPLFVQRTEILRGPQGTLYGRNAMGGAVNTISQRPSQDLSGEVRATYGNYGHYDVEGVVSIPLADNLRMKLGGSEEKADGFIKNTGTANDGGSIHRTYFEGQLEGELGEKTTFWVRYSRTSWDDTTGVGDRWSNLITPYDTTSVVNPLGAGFLQVNPQYGYTTANPGATDPYKMNTNTNGYGQLRGNHLLTAQVTYDLGFADLKYIGGFQQYNYETGGDYDGTSSTTPFTVPGSATLFSPVQTTDFNEFKRYYSNELNLTSKGDGPLSWILGLYQYHENYRQEIQLAEPDQPLLDNPIGGLNQPNPSRDYVDQNATLLSKAYAVFGQASYKVNDAWSVTGGLRYTKDEKSGFESQRLILLSPLVAQGAAAIDVSTDMDPNTPGVQNYRSLSGSWDAVTGTLDVDWTPDRDTLVYAKYSRGYKSGGFMLGTLAPQPEAKQEGVNAYEVGAKKTFMGNLQINSSIFYNDYKNLQLNLSQLNAAGTASASNFVNVDARAYGLELESIWQVTHAWQINASYGYLNTRITKGCCYYDPADPSAQLAGAQPSGGSTTVNGVLLVNQDLAGSPLYQSPKNKFAFNTNYTFDFTPGSLTLSGTYTWTDKTIYQPFNDPAFQVPSYGTADFRALWNDSQKRYTLIAYVKNAFNKLGYTSTGSNSPYAIYGNPNPGMVVDGSSYLGQTGVAITRGLIYPRSYGMELQYRF